MIGPETYVSIDEMKNRLSEMTDRVADGGERIILTSHGRPKVAIISLQDYEKLKRLQQGRQRRLDALAEIERHRKAILKRRGGKAIDVDVADLIHDLR